VGDLNHTWILALAIVQVDTEIGRLASEIEVFLEGHYNVARLCAHEANFLLHGDALVKHWTHDDWLSWADENSPPLSQFGLSVVIGQQISLHWDDLSSQIVSKTGPELTPAALIHLRLLQIVRNLEREWDGGNSKWTNIVLEVVHNDRLIEWNCRLLVHMWLSVLSSVDFRASIFAVKNQ